jgi:hypothetical protein
MSLFLVEEKGRSLFCHTVYHLFCYLFPNRASFLASGGVLLFAAAPGCALRDRFQSARQARETRNMARFTELDLENLARYMGVVEDLIDVRGHSGSEEEMIVMVPSLKVFIKYKYILSHRFMRDAA